MLGFALGLALCGCGKRRSTARDAGPTADGRDARDGGDKADAAGEAGATEVFAELAELPRVVAVRTVELPVRIDVPRFEVHGPVVSGEVAIVASSQLGFAGLDWRRGKLLWSKAAGTHVAPPLVLGSGDVVLLGDCASAPDTEQPVAGCLRIVTSAGVDRSYGAVIGEAKLIGQLRAPGEQRLWQLDEDRVGWRRGAATAVIDLATGRVTAGAPPEPGLIVRYRSAELAIGLDEGELTGRSLDGKRTVWTAPGRFAALLGMVPGQAYEAPMLRVVRASAVRGVGGAPSGAYFDVLDLDAMSAAGGQAAFPAPGILLLGTGSGPGAAAALAVRLDRSLRRDYVVAYSRTARIAWAHPLPVLMRTDPVGLAVTDDAVLVFHDGDTLTVLPPIE